MKTTEFNKLSGTEFRVKKPARAYLTILLWIKDNYDADLALTLNEWNSKFIDWCLENDVYKYKYKKNKISRFSMILNSLNKLGLIQYDKNKTKFEFNESIVEKINEKNIIEWFENEIKFQAFKELVLLINNTKDSSAIKAKEAFLTFSIWEEGESFQNLYKTICKDGYEQTLENISLKNIDSKNYSKNFNFRKKPKNMDNIREIYTILKNKQILSSEEYAKLFQSKYLKDIYKSTNLSDLNLELFKKKLEFFRNKELLEEYFDLFCRWMKDFGYYSNINNKNALLQKKNKYSFPLKYPFNEKDVEQYLKQINQKDFSFKNKIMLKEVPNYTLAEYFVNLFFAYYFSIKPTDFQKYSRTIINAYDLTPISQAPGKGADFRYYDENNKVLYFVETTIHNSENKIINHESFPVANHIKEGLQFFNKFINDFSIKLFVVSIIDKVNENHLFAHCNVKKEEGEFNSKYFESKYLKFKELDRKKIY